MNYASSASSTLICLVVWHFLNSVQQFLHRRSQTAQAALLKIPFFHDGKLI